MQVKNSQVHRSIVPMDDPCPGCGEYAMCVILLRQLLPETTILLPGRQGPQPAPGVNQRVLTRAEGIAAYARCLYCDRRERWSPKNGSWSRTVIDPGHTPTEMEHAAAPGAVA